MKERITYRETYKPGSCVVKKDLLPERLPYMDKGFKIESMELRSAGTVLRGEEEVEFQDVRVYLREVLRG